MYISVDPFRQAGEAGGNLAENTEWHVDGPIYTTGSAGVRQAGERTLKVWLLLHKFPTDDDDASRLEVQPAIEMARKFDAGQQPMSSFSNLGVAPLHALERLCEMLQDRTEGMHDEGNCTAGGDGDGVQSDGPSDVQSEEVTGEDELGALRRRLADPYDTSRPSKDRRAEMFRTCAIGGRPLADRERCLEHYHHATALNLVGCSPAMTPGDLIIFHADTFHRTQDLAVERVALQLDAW